MKKGWKVFWITCGSIGIIGFICCIAALCLGVTSEAVADYFPRGIGIVKYVNNEGIAKEPYNGSDIDVSETYTGITDLDIELSAGTLQIMESDTQEVRFETSNIDSRLHLKYYVEDGELIVETRKNLAGLVNSPDIGTIYLFLPKDVTLDEVDIEVGAGGFYVDSIKANSLKVGVGAGEAVIDSFRALETEFQCGTGRMEASGDPGVMMDVNCGIGEAEISLNGMKEDYSYNLQCGIGDIQLGHESYSGIGIGGNKQINNNTGKEIEIDCGIGSVRVNFNNQ